MTRAISQRRIPRTVWAWFGLLTIVLPASATGCSASAGQVEPVIHTVDPGALDFSYEGTAAPGYIIWDDPEPGRSQQALEVIDLGSTTVPASDHSVLKLSPEVAAEIQAHADQYAASLKAVFSR